MYVNLVGSMMEKKLLATNTRHNVKTDHSIDVVCFFIHLSFTPSKIILLRLWFKLFAMLDNKLMGE